MLDENFNIVFDTDRYFYLFGANNPNILKSISNWWWNKKTETGFCILPVGKEITWKAGCLLRFLLHTQFQSVLGRSYNLCKAKK
jgi:hypothetical protein